MAAEAFIKNALGAKLAAMLQPGSAAAAAKDALQRHLVVLMQFGRQPSEAACKVWADSARTSIAETLPAGAGQVRSLPLLCAACPKLHVPTSRFLGLAALCTRAEPRALQMRALLEALQRTAAAGGVLAVQDGNLLPQQQLLELVAAAEAAGQAPALTLLSSDPRLLGTAVLKQGSLACVELPLVRPLTPPPLICCQRHHVLTE